jgi:hypothetical protein
MKTIQMPIAQSYEVSLRQALSNPAESADYIQAALAESQGEPELLQAVLQDVSIALSTQVLTPELTNPWVTKPILEALPEFMGWLVGMGLQLSVTVKADW